MPDYSKAKIYKITYDNYYYYGSTCNALCVRMAGHRRKCKLHYNKNKLYSLMNNIGVSNFKIVLVEMYPCNNIEELKKKENEYIIKSQTDPLCLNYNRAILTDGERDERQTESQRKYDTKRRDTIIKCDCCNCEYKLCSQWKHLNSKKHLNNSAPASAFSPGV